MQWQLFKLLLLFLLKCSSRSGCCCSLLVVVVSCWFCCIFMAAMNSFGALNCKWECIKSCRRKCCSCTGKVLRSDERNVLIMANKGVKENDQQGRLRQLESERERDSKLDKKGSQPAKCVDYQIYKMHVCVCLLIYAKICISKCSPGTSLLLLNRCWALHAYAPWYVPAETPSWRCRNTSCYELNGKVLLLLLLVLCIMREIKMFA